MKMLITEYLIPKQKLKNQGDYFNKKQKFFSRSRVTFIWIYPFLTTVLQFFNYFFLIFFLQIPNSTFSYPRYWMQKQNPQTRRVVKDGTGRRSLLAHISENICVCSIKDCWIKISYTLHTTSKQSSFVYCFHGWIIVSK